MVELEDRAMLHKSPTAEHTAVTGNLGQQRALPDKDRETPRGWKNQMTGLRDLGQEAVRPIPPTSAPLGCPLLTGHPNLPLGGADDLQPMMLPSLWLLYK